VLMTSLAGESSLDNEFQVEFSSWKSYEGDLAA